MKSIHRNGLVLLALACAMFSLTFAGIELSTGAFLQQLAASAGLPASSPSQAQQSLASSGLDLSSLALEQPLTEATLVSIAAAGGLDVTTSNGETLVSESTAAQFIRVFGNDLTAGSDEEGKDPEAADPPPVGADPRTKGKGKKVGLNRSPSEPL